MNPQQQTEIREKLATLAREKIEFQNYLKGQCYIFRIVETERAINYWAIHPDYYDQWLEGINKCPEEAVILIN